MKRKIVYFFCFSVLVLGAGVAGAFGQQENNAQNNAPKLKGCFFVKPANMTVEAQVASSVLPLFTYNVVSTRNGNSYYGVMVGTNPFGGGAERTSVPTQIVPIVIVT